MWRWFWTGVIAVGAVLLLTGAHLLFFDPVPLRHEVDPASEASFESGEPRSYAFSNLSPEAQSAFRRALRADLPNLSMGNEPYVFRDPAKEPPEIDYGPASYLISYRGSFYELNTWGKGGLGTIVFGLGAIWIGLCLFLSGAMASYPRKSSYSALASLSIVFAVTYYGIRPTGLLTLDGAIKYRYVTYLVLWALGWLVIGSIESSTNVSLRG